MGSVYFIYYLTLILIDCSLVLNKDKTRLAVYENINFVLS